MPAGALSPFRDGGYEILDEDLRSRGEVVIWSVDPVTPRLGDLLLIESAGRLYDVEVEVLMTFRFGWSAKCRAAPL